MKDESLKLKIESYFNCASLLRREGVRRAGGGFTLAEILIALTIIGVISAVTVPVLMQNTQKQEIVTALKKTYSTLSQVTNQIIAEEGSPKASDGGWAKDEQAFYDMYKKYLNNAKECSSNTGCFTQETYKNLARQQSNSFWSMGNDGKYRRLVLADGVQIVFSHVHESCGYGRGNWDTGSDNICGFIFADLNGAKKPNQISRDFFAFVLKENGLFPAGCDKPDACEWSKQYYGFGCTCKVLKEGAINY